MQKQMMPNFRIARRLYWPFLVLLLLGEFFVSKSDQGLRFLMILSWLILYTLRLRDAGRPFYLGAVVMFAEAVLIIGPALFVPDVFLYYYEGAGSPPRVGGEQAAFFASVGAGLLLQVVFAVWLGLVTRPVPASEKAAADYFA
jgi:hypothetical protein